MAFFRKKWTAEEADSWTREDWVTIILSPLCYVGIAVGILLVCLLKPVGFVIIGVTVLAIIQMHRIIDPKLRVISSEYELKQKEYLANLEKTQRWENTDE